ncbi:MAG: ASKHA domain-containing protein, partial [Firmicutes bacterium]|nr:ASKHA domain-containing protein [Bacillota bacterium]
NLGLTIATDSKIYLSPCISAYIGADLVCAVLVSDMLNKEECSLLVDIGTNGEMALYHNGGIKCCSTAAGPVFEGVGIELGSSAIEGAISSVYFNKRNNSIDYKTINDKKPIGICGTGIIDTVSVFLSQGIIDNTGKILKKGHNFSQHIIEVNSQLAFKFDKSDIYITQKDIRQIQLAKGAIAGGINALLIESGVSAQDIDRFYICGGFGSYINLDSAENIGLIPKGMKSKTEILGNAALYGASSIILDNNNIKECAKIVEKSDYIELSAGTVFADEYISSMSF